MRNEYLGISDMNTNEHSLKLPPMASLARIIKTSDSESELLYD
jgi:hypothetical protein